VWIKIHKEFPVVCLHCQEEADWVDDIAIYNEEFYGLFEEFWPFFLLPGPRFILKRLILLYKWMLYLINNHPKHIKHQGYKSSTK